ncbi:MAG TPA: hypothetical protein VGO35_07260 [Gammaproteobacteria bacterium]|nr:hypothetical protein [Gammaproteobacteria bacterium]
MGALIYLPGLPGAFVFDDIGSIADNAAIKLRELSLDGMLHAILSAPVGGLLRPISTLTFVLDAHFFGVSPLPFKITNICIHLVVGILLWYLSRDLLRAYRDSTRKSLDDCTIAWLGLAASTLWLVHPLNLTSVLYTVQRDNSLSALFSVAAILSYLVGRRRGRNGGGGHWHIWVLTPLCTVVGMLCKENAALTPVFILVIEFTLLGFQGGDDKAKKEVYWFFVAFLILPLLAACGLAVLKPGFFFNGYVLRNFTLYERVLSECRILMDYLRWIFVPDLRQLALFHDDIVPSRGWLDPGTTLPCALVIAVLLAGAVTLRKRVPLLSFGILWFFAGQLMESTVLPLELAFEHRNYLPMFGLLLGIIGTLYPVVADQGRAALAKALLVTCILLLALTTAIRSADWQTELTFSLSESQHHPHSARALAELQWAYVGYIVATKDTRLIPLALDAAARSKAADPDNINQDIGLAYMYINLHDIPRAKLHLHEADDEVAIATPSTTLQLALQSLLIMDAADSKPLYGDMTLIFRHALQNPKIMSEGCYGAGIWNSFGVFQRQIGEVPGALGAMHEAVTLCPRDTLMRTNFIETLLAYGDTKDARPQLDALAASHELRYLPEIHHLQEEYAAETAAQRKN